MTGNELGGSLELIKLENHQRNHPRILRGMRESQFLHLSHARFEGDGEVAFVSAKRWDRRNRADLIESATPCHDVQVVGPYLNSNPLRLTVLAAMS